MKVFALALLAFLLAGCSTLQKRECDLLRQGAPIFKPGLHKLQCIDHRATVEMDIKVEQPLCIRTWKDESWNSLSSPTSK